MDVRDTVGEVVSKRLTEQLLNIVGLDDILLVYELDVGLGECFGFFMIFKDKKDRKIARSQSLVSLCTLHSAPFRRKPKAPEACALSGPAAVDRTSSEQATGKCARRPVRGLFLVGSRRGTLPWKWRGTRTP